MPKTADVTYSQFIEHYPEFSATLPEFVPIGSVWIVIPKAPVEHQLTKGNITLSRQEWDRYWSFAVELWTAHYLALRFNIQPNLTALNLRNINTVIGVAQSMSAGNTSLSESRTNPAMLNSENPFYADFARTEYGLEFLSLMQSVISPAGIVLSPDTTDTFAGAR